MNDRDLLSLAKEARSRAFAPYSKFQVGAALLTKNGRVFTGSNIEISSYGLTMCAERVAVFKAVSEGERDFAAMAIAGPEGVAITPCGACRQVLWDFSTEVVVLSENPGGEIVRTSIRELLPGAFGPNFLV